MLRSTRDTRAPYAHGMSPRAIAKTMLPVHPTLTWPDGTPVHALGVSRSGRLIWPQRGGAPDDDEAAAKAAAREAAIAAAKEHGLVVMPQEDLSAKLASEKHQGSRAERKKLLEALGLPEDIKPEDVKAELKKARDAELAAMSEADRAKREAADAKAEIERAKQQADKEREDLARERHELRVHSLLQSAGVGVGAEFEKDPNKVEKALATAMKMLDIEVGADSDVIRKGITDLKSIAPGLFGEVGGGQGSGTPGGGLGSTPTTRPVGGKSKIGSGAGREEAIRRGWRKPEAAKSA